MKCSDYFMPRSNVCSMKTGKRFTNIIDMCKLKFEGEKIEMYMGMSKTNIMKTIDISRNNKNSNDHSLNFQYVPGILLNTSHKFSNLL